MNNKFGYGDDHKSFILFTYLFIYVFFFHLVQGGYLFSISFREELPLEFEKLLVRFEGLGESFARIICAKICEATLKCLSFQRVCLKDVFSHLNMIQDDPTSHHPAPKTIKQPARLDEVGPHGARTKTSNKLNPHKTSPPRLGNYWMRLSVM